MQLANCMLVCRTNCCDDCEREERNHFEVDG